MFTGVNMAGLHAGVRLQHVLSIFKVLIIVSISGLIFWFGKEWTPFPVSESGRNSHSFTHFALALIPILWSYGGWHESTFMSGEFRDARKELPLSLIASALIVMVLYVLINFAYLKVMAPAEIAQSQAVASDALVKLFGNAGKAAITVAIVISALGALNSTILSGGRIPFAVGQDKKGLSWLGQADPRFKTPLRALAVNGVWASVLVFLGSFEQLLFFNAFEIWLFFILVGISVFILRRRKRQTDSFLMLGYPWVPILFSLVSFWLCLTTVWHAPREALFGAFVILAGAPLYYLVRGKRE
jgi:APA family basic amino acid/polyamine antiporter